MNRLVILLLSVLISYAACDVIVVKSKQSVAIGKGQGYTLRCTVSGSDTFDRWGNPLYTSSLHNDSNIQYVNNGDEHDLQIASMNIFTAGIWTCYSKEGNSDYITLTFSPSLVTRTEKQQNLIKDRPGAIYIDIRGYPRPDFIWKKDGVELNITGRYSVASNGTLFISNVQSGDGGTYDARGTKDFFNADSGEITVTVLVAPSINGTSVQESRTIGSNISFECTAIGVPEPTITWKKGSDVIRDGGRFIVSDSGLLITDIKPSDVGDYKCIASNSVGTKQRISSLVSVHIPPEIKPLENEEVVKEQSLIVDCNATGSPTPTVEWYKDGKVLPPSQQIKSPGKSVLTLRNIRTDQGGVYECSAMNDAVDSMGRVIRRNQSINVNVVYPPHFGPMKETIHVRLNYPITIICNASGIPIPVIKLSHGSENIQGTVTNISSHSTLAYFINNTDTDNLGVYTCTASSRLNSIQKTITLSVPLDKPEISNIHSTCNSVSFSWHRDTQSYIKVTSYIVTITADEVEKKSTVVSGNTSQATFSDLDENTRYELKVIQKTDVLDIGYESTENTNTTTCPLKDINEVSTNGNKVTVYWPEATKSVDNYVIKYRISGSSDEWKDKTTEKIFIEISGLEYGKTYEFKVFYQVAGTELPYTQKRDVEIPTAPTPSTTRETESLATKEPSVYTGKPPGKVARKEGLSGGAIAAIVIVIILLVLIAVDIFCCFFNQCGVVHMCAAACAGRGREKYNVDGSPEEGTKLKEIDEDGKEDPEA